MKAVQCRHAFRQLLVGSRAETKSTVVAITKRVQFAVSSHDGAMLEATRHLNSRHIYN